MVDKTALWGSFFSKKLSRLGSTAQPPEPPAAHARLTPDVCRPFFFHAGFPTYIEKTPRVKWKKKKRIFSRASEPLLSSQCSRLDRRAAVAFCILRGASASNAPGWALLLRHVTATLARYLGGHVSLPARVLLDAQVVFT